jgi:hypothetical protein
VNHRVQRRADGGLEVGADSVGDRDERRLHHLIERDAEELGRLTLVTKLVSGSAMSAPS